MLLWVHFLRHLRKHMTRRREYRVIFPLMAVIVLSSLGFYWFERPSHPDLQPMDGVWWTLVTMTTVGYGDISPTTVAGRFLIAVPTMLAGGGILAYGLSTFTSFVIETKHKELRGMQELDVNDHIVLINYPGEAKVLDMLSELRHDAIVGSQPIVLLTDRIEELPDSLNAFDVSFVHGSPINEDALARAHVQQARDAIVFAHSDDENSDSFNLGVLVALSALDHTPRIVVECIKPSRKALMKSAGASEVICVTELATQLLGQARQGFGIQALFSDLASNRTPQQVDIVPIELDQPMAFSALSALMHKDHILLIGITRNHEQIINPGHQFLIRSGDDVLVICDQQPTKLSYVTPPA